MIDNSFKLELLSSYENEHSQRIRDEESKRQSILNFQSPKHASQQRETFEYMSSKQHMETKRRSIKIPLSLLQNVIISERQIQFYLNDDCDAQLFRNQKASLIRFFGKESLRLKILQQQANQFQKIISILRNTISIQANAFSHGGNNHFEQGQKLNKQIDGQNERAKNQTAHIDLWDIYTKRFSAQQKTQQSSLLQLQAQQRQTIYCSDRYSIWTRQQHLKYIAFVLTHQQFLNYQNSKFKVAQFSNYVTNGNAKKLSQKTSHYRHEYANQTLSEIASIIIKKFSFTKKQIEAEKQKAFQFKASNERISVAQFSLDSEFFKLLQTFPTHQFPQTHIQIIQQEIQTQISCTKVKYSFIPWSQKTKIRNKNLKYYQINFEIELTLPSVQIIPVFNHKNQTQESQNDRQAQGFWISINGDRKQYFSKSQVINRMRIIDFETKANEVEIIELIFAQKITDLSGKQNLTNEEEVMKKGQQQKRDLPQIFHEQPIQNRNKQTHMAQASQSKTSQINQVKKDRKRWSYEDNLRCIQFLNRYEPAFLNFQQKFTSFRYFKVMSEYVKFKTCNQCYDYFACLMEPYKNFKQFIENELKALMFGRQSIQNHLKQNIHLWLKNSPMVIIEKRERPKDYHIKQSLGSISDQKFKSLLSKFIEKSKIKIVIGKQLEKDGQFSPKDKDCIHVVESLDKNLNITEEKFNKCKTQVKKSNSQIYSIIPLNWKDIQATVLYQYMSQNQAAEQYLESQKERKLSLRISYSVKIKEKDQID